MKLLVLNGPNINLLGIREPDIYGKKTYDDLLALVQKHADELGVEVEFQVINWDTKIEELDGKTIDCVWNGMTLTDAVMNAMTCSNAYCNNAQVVITK